MNGKLRPLVKWTGGKFDEFALFSSHIPNFDRYIEPFFGGGGVFFALQPKGRSYVNDKSSDLINFYKQITETEFKRELLLYADAWDELGRMAASLWEISDKSFVQFIEGEKNEKELTEAIQINYHQSCVHTPILANEEFIIDADLFNRILVASVVDKAKRIKRISSKESRNFTKIELYTHFETGVRSGGYLFFRKLLNLHYQKMLQLSVAKAVANWYFVREFCYASMFRFNAKGEFNIPYGGIAYNRKKIREKIGRIFTQEVRNLFKQTVLSNTDFEVFLTNLNLTEGDFIFLDPPYDSEFSEYDQSAFTRKDQERLAVFLKSTSAKWMVVIKETPFIRNLYLREGIKIKTFDKTYAYNVRGRNGRQVKHLIITNYSI